MARPLVRMRLHGAKELEAALRNLPKRVGKAAVRRALVKAGTPVAQDAASRVSAVKPALEPAVAVKTTLSRRQRRGRRKIPGAVEAFIGVTAAGRGVAHLIEFGTGPRHHKSGKSTGQMPARPFMRPAWESGKHKVLDDFARLLWVEIEKAAKRLAKKATRTAKG